MASIIFIVSTVLLVFLLIQEYDGAIPVALGVIAIVGMLSSLIAILWAVLCFGDGITAADKIKSYEERKVRIEKEMGTMVNAYMDYEKDNVKRISDKDAVSYVTVIPELKSSDLVKQEMALYADYDKRIMKLKEQQADTKLAKFILYKNF